jgi:hypothetical protein
MTDRHDHDQHLVGLFASRDEAERAVDVLVRQGIDPERVSFVGPGDVDEPSIGKSAAVGVGTGATAGAVAGGLLGAASLLAVPGVGPVLTAGVLLPVVMGIVTGAAGGGTAGALFGAAAGGGEGLYFLQEVKAGRSLVNVATDGSERVGELLERAGAIEVSDVGKTETARRIEREA